MTPRPQKATDAEVFAALVRVMMRVGPAELTLAAIAEEAGLTAGALVQRFGSKRELLLAHAKYAANTGDIGLQSAPRARRSPLAELRASADTYAELASSPDAALRNLAYLHRDMSEPALHRNLVRMSHAARAHYAGLVAAAIEAGELRKGTNARALARAIETTLVGSYVSWAIYREGAARAWLRKDLDALLKPYVV